MPERTPSPESPARSEAASCDTVAISCEAAASAVCQVDGVPDLTVLVHRAAQGLRQVVDRACRRQGLTDGRDWLVLTALTDRAQRSQLELARLLGIDKSTLTLVLDRLEHLGLVVRPADPADRRVRVPQITSTGRRVWQDVRGERDQIELAVLEGVPEEALETTRAVLGRIAEAESRVLTATCDAARP